MSADSNRRFDDATAAQQRIGSLSLSSKGGIHCRMHGAARGLRPPRTGRFGASQWPKAPFFSSASWRLRFGRVACASFLGLALAARAAGIFDIRIPHEFNRVVDTNIAALATNAYVNYWLEGPVWVPGDPGYLIFSSINFNYANSNNRLKKLVLPNAVSDFLVPPAYTVYNGNILDGQERLISCQSGTAGLRVVMITNGVVTPLVSTCAGLKFYSPNDVAVKSDGTLWFSDPGFNGNTATPPQPGYQYGHYVYRFDPTDGNATCTPVVTNSSIYRPNGLCFSPDEDRLYLADYDARAIRVYALSSSNTLSGGSVFATLGNGNPDGIRCDTDGRVYSSSSNGIWIYLPDGRLIGRIITARTVANLCFGGADWRTLFITAQPNVLSIQLRVAGAVSRKTLQVSSIGNSGVRVAWPWPSTGFQLQASTNLGTGTWTPVPDTPSVSNGRNLIEFDATNAPAFFRLQMRPP
ncbi:MAG: SMP-30/gluconolactonase/LRE family protein [Verrucomicrobia bacterium]|nr:SMP-30/gluconolactonase/LRE family protein [Verrucomicrobiota bacterium]